MKIKAILVGASMTCIASMSSAGMLTDMTSLFMSNTTAPTTISTQDRVGAFGGSIHVRAPVAGVNLVTFDPPRFDAGCGGVDLSMGSFSFINSAQLVQVFRAIAANAVGLAFKAGINAISPSLGNLMSEFQTLLQKMNNLSKNTCALAGLVMKEADSALASAVGGPGVIGGVANNMFSDATAALTSYVAGANSYLSKVGSVNPKSGNTNAKAIQASGASALVATQFANADGSTDNSTDPNSLNNRLLISFMGYEVNGLPCQNQNGAGVPDSSASAPGTIGTVTCTGAPTVTLKDLIEGGAGGSASSNVPLTLYTCLNPNGDPTQGGPDPQICTQMQAASFPYLGIQGYINTALFGQADPSLGVTPTSIVGMFNSNASVNLAPQQVQFIKQSGVPLIPLFGKTSNAQTRIQIAQMLSGHITACLAAQVGATLYKGAIATQNGGENNLSTDTKANLAALRADYAAQQRVCDSDQKVLQAIQGVNESIKFMANNNR